MWETPFEISMLENPDIVIHCPARQIALAGFFIPTRPQPPRGVGG